MFIHTTDENNPEVRECPVCHNWYSLLETTDENGVQRTYNHQPRDKGICTCQ